MKIQGTVQRVDLEGGIYQLAADDGRRFTLAGARAELRAAQGSRVEVEGEVDAGGMGLAMAGPVLRVSRLTRI